MNYVNLAQSMKTAGTLYSEEKLWMNGAIKRQMIDRSFFLTLSLLNVGCCSGWVISAKGHMERKAQAKVSGGWMEEREELEDSVCEVKAPFL